MHAFFSEGQKLDKWTNGQTHIGGWVENVTNRQTHIGGWVENVTNRRMYISEWVENVTNRQMHRGKKGDIHHNMYHTH